eukprot:m.186465 g.186465  ORF g.186465 m.186465 type:complete len:77 (+) comp15053_c1_seq1:867-1097(+)
MPRVAPPTSPTATLASLGRLEFRSSPRRNISQTAQTLTLTASLLSNRVIHIHHMKDFSPFLSFSLSLQPQSASLHQ